MIALASPRAWSEGTLHRELCSWQQYINKYFINDNALWKLSSGFVAFLKKIYLFNFVGWYRMKLYILTIVMCLIILPPAQVSTDKDCKTSKTGTAWCRWTWFRTMQIFESAINFMKKNIYCGSRNPIIAHHDSKKTKSGFFDWWQLLYVNYALCYQEQLLNDHCAYFASITTSLLKGQHTLVICTGKGEYNRR